MQTSKKRSVIGIIFDPSRKQILLIKRRDVPMWALPGGGVDAPETPEVAVVREVFEETGLNVQVLRQVALYTPINRLTNDTYVFECQAISGSLSSGDETLQASFFPLEDLPKPFFFLHGEWIADALQQLPSIIRKPLSQITYLALIKYFCRHPVQVVRLLLSRIGRPINSR